jgi:hypothetical protein
MVEIGRADCLVTGVIRGEPSFYQVTIVTQAFDGSGFHDIRANKYKSAETWNPSGDVIVGLAFAS